MPTGGKLVPTGGKLVPQGPFGSLWRHIRLSQLWAGLRLSSGRQRPGTLLTGSKNRGAQSVSGVKAAENFE